MADVFQPEVAQINSAVTPTQGVPNTSAVELFADVANVATDAAFSFTGQQELSELKTKFNRVVQAREAGGNSSALQVKARADLDAAKANMPWVAQQADKLYADTFGGSVFEDTPEEKARKKHLQRVEETRLSLGLSTPEEAQKRITLDENAKSAKIQADAQKNVREYNGELVFSNTQTQLNNNTIKFMDAINRVMTQNGGSLSSENSRSLNLTVDQQVATLKAELNTQTRDPNSGHLLIDKAGYDANLKEIEDWATDTKAMVADQDYAKLINNLNAEQSAEINLIAAKKYRTLKLLEASGGQAAVNAYLVAAQRPEGAAKQLLIGANPVAKDMFKQPGSFNQASSDGLDKIILSTPQNVFLSQPEAMATGTILNDPANSKVLTTTVEEVATNSESVEPYKEMIKWNPDSAALTWSNQFKAWKNANPQKGEVVLDHSMDALKKSFMSAYASENGSIPNDFNIGIAVKGNVKKTSVGSKLFDSQDLPLNRVTGDGMSPVTGSILMNMYKVLKENPDYAKSVKNQLSLVDETPNEEVVKAMVLGVQRTPDDIAFQEHQAREGQNKNSSGEGGANTPALPENTLEASFDALTESSPEEIANFQKALRGAKDAAEKAEVHAAFIDGQFRSAK